MTTLPEYVALVRTLQPDPAGNAAVPGGFYQFLQRYAVLRDGSALPEGLRRRPFGRCYQNAFDLSREVDGLLYCEGLATNAAVGVPMEHAWCLHVDSGRVIDPTWDEPERGHYYGVTFERPFVTRFALRTGVYGMLAWENDPSCLLYERGVQLNEAGIVVAYADEEKNRHGGYTRARQSR